MKVEKIRLESVSPATRLERRTVAGGTNRSGESDAGLRGGSCSILETTWCGSNAPSPDLLKIREDGEEEGPMV